MSQKSSIVPLDKVSIMRGQGLTFEQIGEVLEIQPGTVRMAWSRSGLAVKMREAKALIEARQQQEIVAAPPQRTPEELLVATVTAVNDDPVAAYKKAAGKVVNRIAENIANTATSDPKAMAGQAVTIKTINEVAKTVYGLEKDSTPSFVFNMGALADED